MTTTILEQMARAHHEASHDMRVELPWKDCHPAYRAQEIGSIKAALQPLLGYLPEEIWLTGWSALEHDDSLRDAFHAMIRKILEDQPTTTGEG